MKKHNFFYLFFVLIMVLGFACTASPPITAIVEPPTPTAKLYLPTETKEVATEITPSTSHIMEPSDLVPAPGRWVDDADASGTGLGGWAPYGDSYKLNRFERPFLQDMKYVLDMDIRKFGLSEDETWYYISIQLIGSDPNNPLEIYYGAEIDTNADGFGDFLIWTHPPYTAGQWNTDTVQVFQDSNHDTAGQSASESDPGNTGNGYDTLIFHGDSADTADPDLAWVRLDEGQPGLIQIAFKKSLTGPALMLGVVADDGLKDVSQYDYADHFAESDAGSPLKDDRYFPLGALYAIDNTCWEAFGMQTTGFEPKLCPPTLQPVNTPVSACNPPPDCGGGPYNPETCECQ